MKKVSSFVLKIASRCNLNCSYCYMYNMGDSTYLAQPKFMSIETVLLFAQRLKTYCKDADIQYVSIIFHGGEPLLLKPDFYEKCLAIFKEIAPELEYRFAVQTNGVTLNQDWYTMFNRNQIAVGISMDGPKKYHDRYRVFHNDKGSYNEVAEAIKLGKKNQLAGILMVMNIEIPVQELYKELKELEIQRLNILFPDGYYQNLPQGFDPVRYGCNDYTPYADWLISLYKTWKLDKTRPHIYFFESIIQMVIGDEGIGNQLMGRRTNGVVGIETDGSIEVIDSLRACFEGITKNNISVKNNEISDIFQDSVFDMYYYAHEQVCEQCVNCPIYDICGGGFIGHRYSRDDGFDNPTIYCKDMIKLISFIQNDIILNLPKETIRQLGVSLISYEEILEEVYKPSRQSIDGIVRQKLRSFQKNSN